MLKITDKGKLKIIEPMLEIKGTKKMLVDFLENFEDVFRIAERKIV